MTEEIIIDGIDVSEWTDEEVHYNFKKHSPKAIRQIAFDLYKQLKRKEQKLEKIKDTCNTYQMEYMVNNGVNLLTTKILQIIEDE